MAGSPPVLARGLRSTAWQRHGLQAQLPASSLQHPPKATRVADVNWWQKKMDFSWLFGDL